MATLTAQDIKTWPKPNYDNPTTLAPAIYSINIVCILAMTIFVAGRFWSRTVIVKGALARDDWTMLAAYVLCVTIGVLHLVEVQFGVGRHLYDVEPQNIDLVGKMILVGSAMYAPATGMTKISICLSYLRLFPSRTNKWFNYITISMVLGFAISTCVVAIFQCSPIRDQWDVMKALSEKNCINIPGFFVWVTTMNAITDFLVYLWPIHYLWSVQISASKRIGLIISFSLGVVVCIFGMIRIWQIITYFNSWDRSWNGAILYLVMSVEVSLGLICGCLPGIRPLLSQLFPRVFGSMAGSNSSGYANGNMTNTRRDNTSGLGARRAGFRDLKTIEVRTDIELRVKSDNSDVSSSDGVVRQDSPYVRSGSEDRIIPPSSRSGIYR
ncbi:hypothetical protein BKA66DRAFT_533589 [Pyrenochaeta sp. MPI-SDFR-AT-0127]|nr:hypothetical protein BKA66DRAFT_533589 [Pyrenochaeta sp. MPI-SDFR-AT-0127]